MVHVNRVKPCYGLPVTQFRTRRCSSKQSTPSNSTSGNRLEPAGYTDADTEPLPLAPLLDNQTDPGPVRPQRHCDPPIRFGDFITH